MLNSPTKKGLFVPRDSAEKQFGENMLKPMNVDPETVKVGIY